jgi:CYTH domain-containing protein
VDAGKTEMLRTVEVEFSSESQAGEFSPPAWFGQEVTGDARYANAELAG